jgi:hypothetical protein
MVAGDYLWLSGRLVLADLEIHAVVIVPLPPALTADGIAQLKLPQKRPTDRT